MHRPNGPRKPKVPEMFVAIDGWNIAVLENLIRRPFEEQDYKN